MYDHRLETLVSERLRCNFNDLHLGTKHQHYTGVLMCAIKIAILLPTAIRFVLETIGYLLFKNVQ